MDFLYPVSTAVSAFIVFFLFTKKIRIAFFSKSKRSSNLPINKPLYTEKVFSGALHDFPKYLIKILHRPIDSIDEIEIVNSEEDLIFCISLEENILLQIDVFRSNLSEEENKNWTLKLSSILSKYDLSFQNIEMDEDILGTITLDKEKSSICYPIILQILEAFPIHLKYQDLHVMYHLTIRNQQPNQVQT